MSVSDCNLFWKYYAGFQNSTAKSLCNFEKNFIPFSYSFQSYSSEISVSSILINIVHVFILTRKPMRTSSINILMAAVALFDIFTNFQQIEIIFERNTSIFFECFPTDTYGVILTRAIFDIVNDYSRRCSTWFIVSIAFMRTLMVRNPLHSTYQSLGNPNASVIVISGVCAASLPISIFKFFETQFFVVTESLYVCALQGTYYLAAMSHFFMKNNGFIAKYFSLFNSFVSDIIPCLLLPIVTVLLVMDLWKTAKKRANIVSVSNKNNFRSKTGLVFCVTIMFFLVEFPYGSSLGAVWMYKNAPGMQQILAHVGFIFSMLITLNTCTHFFICLLISSQYRKTIIHVLSCGFINSKKTSASKAVVNLPVQSKTLP
ncbi:G-protein coupled receptors family 1 profile domain-containing protein [Caenorhabditis elegans]|uniref:G-protein coupled receptors family 1 profile domain-containing protein n=1 Tax=Caenorhabditis elegans TaxID=6239 RepID=Q8IFY0_CAEEL|nr:G-protein coupled receptors family 1 profile domain-containing protein [Caenorhabditis elegans]CCD67249.1 G-protein coupled receptors family 1 profile domain-containing protein [Caenorhabditis elegans]|eukprot:NP_503812.1 Serpentine Receptor, class W [Caenorhabditis elegans]